MANEGERSTAADKGKGKVDDVRELNGKKPQKDEKTTEDGKKKDEEPQEGTSRQHPATHIGAERVASAGCFAAWTQMLTSSKMSSVRRTNN